MVNPVSLSQMEMQLYGGVGLNSSAPSYSNNYCGASAYLNPYYNVPFNSLNNTNFGQTIPQGYATNNTAQTQQTGTSAFQGLSQKESEAIVNYYAKGLTPTQTLMAAGVGQAGFAALNHPRLIAHPWNSAKTFVSVEKMFKGVKDASTPIGKLWADPKNNDLLREAYMQTHKAKARLETKLGLFRRSYGSDAETKKIITGLLDDMEKALKAGNKDKVAEITAKLQQSYVSDGYISRGWNWAKNLVTGGNNKVQSVSEALKDTSAIATKKAGLLKEMPTKFKAILKSGQGAKGALIFAGITALLGFGKITTAFQSDKENSANGKQTNNGWKQLGQTAIASVGGALGWGLGEATGKWAFAKCAAKLGKCLGGGIPSLIGGLIGIVGGGIGMCLFEKLGRKVVGRDVADKIEAENLAKTEEGQQKLLQYAAEQIQAGKQLPPDVQQAIEKLMLQYSQTSSAPMYA